MSNHNVTPAPAGLDEVVLWLDSALGDRLTELGDDPSVERYVGWADRTSAGLAGAPNARARDQAFALALSSASRYAPRGPLEATPTRVIEAGNLLPGWNPSRWTSLEAVRVRLILQRAALDDESLPGVLEEAFRYADEGELCALYRSLQFLPGGERFVLRSAEGCRTNMKTVFEANGMDTAYPVAHFDDVAWRQLAMKSLFVEAPLWRVHGLDGRLDEELSRMALDLAEERRSAGRSVFPELWLCLGHEPTERKLESIERELSGEDELSRKGAILALGRLGQTERLQEVHEMGGTFFGPIAQWALMGRHDQTAFATISPPEGALPATRDHDSSAPMGEPFDFSSPDPS